MVKKYEIPDNEQQIVSEPVMAYADEDVLVKHSEEEWDESDAPCMFSPEELCTVILQSFDDEKYGKVHSHAEVQSMINARIEAWR